MNAQDLKNSILQLAVQGKLVEQRAEEGTARELLEQIKLEKDQLIKDKKIKKSKPLPEITENEIPFEIPENWEWVRLGQIINIESGKGLTSKDMKEGEIPVFGGNGITGYHNEALVNKETVVIGRVGFYCGSVYLTPPKAWVTDNAFITTYPEQYIDREYLIHTLRHMNLGKSHNATAQPVVSGKKIYPLLFPIPPLAEQHRIVAKIEEILPYIEQYDKAYTKLETFNKKFPEDMKKSILQLAMQGKLVEQRQEEGTADELYEQIAAEKAQLIKDGKIKKEKPLPEITENEIPFEIPTSWKWVRLGEVALFQGGYAFKSTEYIQQPINQVIRLGNVKQGKLLIDVKPVFVGDEQAEKAKDYIIKANDILVTMTGTRRKKDYLYICKVTKNDINNRKLLLNQRVGCFRTYNYIDVDYLVLALQNNTIRDIIFQKETGTANQGNLGSEDMKKYIYIPLPPLAEQKRIVAKIEELLPYCDRLMK